MPINPILSVIIPTWNRAEWLPEAIASCRDADEILVVDDGSTDETPLLRERFPQVRWFHQSNQGPAAARNLALKNAKGQFVLFLDSDDQWAPPAFPILRERLQNYPCLHLLRTKADSRKVTHSAWRSIPEAILAGVPFQTGCLAAPTQLLRSVGGFPSMAGNAEDLDLALRLGDHPCFSIDSPSLFHTGHSANQRTRHVGHTLDGMRWLVQHQDSYPGDPNITRSVIALALRATSREWAGHPEGRAIYELGLSLQWKLGRYRYVLGFPLLHAWRRNSSTT